MKKIILILVLLLKTVVLFGQNEICARVIYNVGLKQFEVNEETTKKQLAYNQLVSKSGQKTYVLDIKNNKSLFYDNTKMESESKQVLDFTSIFVGNGLFYFDKSEKIILNEKDFLGEDFIIKIPPKIDWEFTQEKKIIGNHNCLKAMTTKKIINRIGKIIEKKVIVWYNPKITINFGIKEYQNLPGIIVQLEEDGLIYELKEININNKLLLDIKKPSKGKIVTESDYTEILLKDYRQKF